MHCKLNHASTSDFYSGNSKKSLGKIGRIETLSEDLSNK